MKANAVLITNLKSEWIILITALIVVGQLRQIIMNLFGSVIIYILPKYFFYEYKYELFTWLINLKYICFVAFLTPFIPGMQYSC